jgi:hypothetical protein
VSGIRHLARRTWLSIVDRRCSDTDLVMVRRILDSNELSLWERMQPVDQRHSVRVLERFGKLLPNATRAERAAVLLHDVGKSVSRLGTFARIGATLGVLRSHRASQYRSHEPLGLELATTSGVNGEVLELMRGHARTEFMSAFARADDE